MPEVQVDTAQNAIALALKNGTTDFAQEIGPDWRNHFDSLAEQIQYARDKGIPLANMETKSGGMQPTETKQKGSKDEQN